MQRVLVTLFALFWVAFVGVIVLAIFLGVAYLLDDPRADVAAVRKQFEAIPNVRVTYISDLTKQASQSITAYVEIKGDLRMGFGGLSASSFGHTSRIWLSGIGPYDFRTRGLERGSEYYGYSINIGTSSPIPAARRLGITSIQSAIAHYDELMGIVAHWPVTTNDWPKDWPAKIGEWSKTSEEEVHFPNPPKGDYYFCLKWAADGDEQMWPPNYTKASR